MIRSFDILAILVVAWALASAMPVSSLWYAPGHIVVTDALVGQSPKIGFTREIKRDVTMRYAVTIRSGETLGVVCEDRGLPIQYKSNAVTPTGVDMKWWAPGDQRCHSLPAGVYVMETCWTATERFWGLLLPRTICRESNVFRIGEGK